jgi:hypothetical protein
LPIIPDIVNSVASLDILTVRILVGEGDWGLFLEEVSCTMSPFKFPNDLRWTLGKWPQTIARVVVALANGKINWALHLWAAVLASQCWSGGSGADAMGQEVPRMDCEQTVDSFASFYPTRVARCI